MESTNTFYPVFEPDQVLTSDHLNQLRAFLAAQDRLSRRLLHGIGIVCGLEISNPDKKTIRISKGVGITSKGFLITLETSDCTYFRPYKDKIFNEECCDNQIEGKYELFLDANKQQYNLWELLTDKEEKEINDKNIKPLSAAKIKLKDMYLLLYLEIEDMDMLACFGEDCDEKGIQRHFRVRKLIIQKNDLLSIIKEAKNYEAITEGDLKEEINARYKLRPVNIKRLGYDFSTTAQTLSLKNYHNFKTLFSNYSSVIKDGIKDVGMALYNSYIAFKPLLKDLYPANPFKDFDSGDQSQNPLFNVSMSALNSNRLMVQYVYDFLNDLVDAYDEFREHAFQLAVMCSPDPKWFPRHLMLGKAIRPEEQPSVFRHHFIYSPILGKQQDLLEKVKLYHQRLVKMVKEFNTQAINYKEIKFTPSSMYSEPISKRAIPFYYDVNDSGKLYKFWNYDKKKRITSDTILSYHAENIYGKDEFIEKPLLWNYKKYDFLRVEGHVGKNYEKTLANLLGKQEKLNLPVKIVGIKLSRRFANTNIDAECHFDDLQTLYNTFTTELKCMLLEEAGFFRELDTNLAIAGSPDVSKVNNETEKVVKKAKNPANEILNLLGAGKNIEKNIHEVDTGKSGTKKTGFDSGKTEKYIDLNDESIQVTDFSFDYFKPTEGTIGYMIDNIDLSGQDLYSSIFNIFASGQLEFMVPGVFIYTILYPVQIASNIDTLLKNIPEKLEDLDVKTLNKDYKTLVNSATGFRKSIQDNLKDPKYQRVGNEEMILYRLDKLIYHCSIRKILNIYKLYLKKINEVRQLNLFSRFAKDHPGLEHMAGVPKGGTLVLVYIDTNDRTMQVKPGEIHGIFRPESDLPAMEAENRIYEKNPDEMNLSGPKPGTSEDKLIPPTVRTEMSNEKRSFGYESKEYKMEMSDLGMISNDNYVLDYLNQNRGKLPQAIIDRIEASLGLVPFPPDKLPPNNVIVADFALPYLCCGSCPEISTMVVSQIVFRLEDTVYCAGDTNKYEFTFEPAGGKISGPGVQPVGGGYVFQPSSIDWKKEDIQLNYLVNNQTVVLNLKVYKPVAGFTASKPVLVGKNQMKVTFTNNCLNADSYSFDFGNGEKYEGNLFPADHIYKDVENGQKASITLTAKKDKCSSPPVSQDIIFEVETPIPSRCYTVDILLCWGKKVLEMLKYDPFELAFKSRGVERRETLEENANILLEILMESCGFQSVDFNEDGGSIFQLEAKKILLNCLLDNEISVNYDPERKYKNNELERIITAYQKEKCCTSQNKSLKMDNEWLASLSGNEKKSILKERGVSEIENKDDKTLTDMIIETGNGLNLTKGEVSVLSVNSIKKILMNNNVSITGRMKKNDLIKLIP